MASFFSGKVKQLAILRNLSLNNLRRYSTKALTGTVSGTTISSASAAVAMIGRYVLAENGPAKGQLRRIVGAVAATSLTIQAAYESGGTGSTTQWSLWESGQSYRATSNGSTTTTIINEAPHDTTIATDDLKGAYIVALNGSNAGQVKQISAYNTTTETITHAAFTNATAQNDAFLILHPVYFNGDGGIEADDEEVAVDAATGDMSHRESVAGPKAGSATMRVPWRSSAAAGLATASILNYELDHILGNQLSTYVDTGSETDHGTATGSSDATFLVINTATQENFTVGGAIMVRNEIVCVGSKVDGAAAGDTLAGIYPELSFTPADNEVVNASAGFLHNLRPSQMVTADIMEDTDGLIRYLFGAAWAGELELGGRAGFPTFSFNWEGIFLEERQQTRIATLSLPTTNPISSARSRITWRHSQSNQVILDHIDGTLDLGFEVQRLEAAGGNAPGGYVMAAIKPRPPKLRVRCTMDDAVWAAWRDTAGVDVLRVQWGSAPGLSLGFIAKRAQLVRARAVRGDAYTHELEWLVLNPNDNTLPIYTLAAL